MPPARRRSRPPPLNNPHLPPLSKALAVVGGAPSPPPPSIWALIRARFCGAKSVSGCRAQGGWGGSAHYPDPTAQSVRVLSRAAAHLATTLSAQVQRVRKLNTAACLGRPGVFHALAVPAGFSTQLPARGPSGGLRVRRRRSLFRQRGPAKAGVSAALARTGGRFPRGAGNLPAQAEHDSRPTPGIRLS